MTDIEIAKNVKLEEINKIAEKIGIKDEELEQYGKYKAKINLKTINRLTDKKDGKLILVTAMSPTTLGEGKTTMSIAIADGLSKINKKSILALREPSLGPVFGIKGGATGGGRAQVAPMEDINLHFTGDIHAITAANNLLSSLIDNHIYFGNELKFKKVVWKRCLDLNDRQLRKVETGLSNEKNIVPRTDSFDITVASEIMAILCLSQNIVELKENLGNILVGYDKEEKPIYAKQLKAEGALATLLKDAIKPNLVQTLEHTPAIIHGGPFANIAHGCNSIIATKLGMKLADYTITEAGFGADLGAEKFLDIKCRKAKIKPDIVVIVATIKALKYHGGVEKEKIQEENVEAIKIGIKNLKKHIENIKEKFGLNVIIALNHYNTDTQKEIEYLQSELSKENVEMSIVDAWEKGGEGAIDIASKIVKNLEQENNIVEKKKINNKKDSNELNEIKIKNNSVNQDEINYIYDLNDDIKTKIEKVSKNIYGAIGVKYENESLQEIEKIEKMGYNNLPICIAKTQYSLSDDPKNLQGTGEYYIHVKSVELKSGAGFIVVITGKIMTMPGLPRKPAAENIDIDSEGNITGIF